MNTRLAAIAAALCLSGAHVLVHAAEVDYKLMSQFGVAVGAPFPLDALVDTDGKPMPKDRFHGKHVLINFYTKYCAPCIREVPKLNEVMKRRGDLHVLAMTPDPRDEAAKYVQQYGLTWPVAAGAEPVIGRLLNVHAFPSFALLDAKGQLVATVQANQLGGEDGNATVEGIERWVDVQMKRTRP